MKIEAIDHIVLTVSDIDTTCAFYSKVLGMRVDTFNGDRKALFFGNQKINLHQHGSEFEPKARRAMPGAGDLCFITEVSLSKVIDYLNECHIEVLEGPVQRSGAVGRITSVYFRDPDGNLLEVASYLEECVECLS